MPNPSASVQDLRSAFAEAPLYAIIDTAVRPDLPSAKVMDLLLSAGVQVIQYRHKDEFLRSNWDECCALAEKARARGALFFVNDRSDAALLSGATGVHLGQDDLPPEMARRFCGDGVLVGYSTHTFDQARLADSLPVDYLAIGPVFSTASKKNPDPVIGIETVRAVRSVTSKPLVAIGGITIENAASVLEAGVDAVAVIGGVLSAPDIAAQSRAFLQALRSR